MTLVLAALIFTVVPPNAKTLLDSLMRYKWNDITSIPNWSLAFRSPARNAKPWKSKAVSWNGPPVVIVALYVWSMCYRDL